ncbi:hypothetical protein HAX54_006951 [Datura stramonium]|uniref:Uncharacterized protein n=1 Tax=Datura stramonium TaxID=4076 RepID=A0ABS8TC83_DATST|nr:hypothetical protein [Datura stramonium]
MAELAQAADVYAPRTLPAWRSLLNWLAFFFQIFVQIVKNTFSQSGTLLPEEAPPLPQQPSVTVSTLQIAAGSVPDGNGEQRLAAQLECGSGAQMGMVLALISCKDMTPGLNSTFKS